MDALYFVNMLLRMYQQERAMLGDPDPRRQSYRLANLWRDLCRLAQEPLPPDIRQILEAPPHRPPTTRYVVTLIVTIEAGIQEEAVDYAMSLWPTTTKTTGVVRECYVETVEREGER